MGQRNQLVNTAGENRSKLFSYLNLLFQNYIKNENCQDKRTSKFPYCSKEKGTTLRETRTA